MAELLAEFVGLQVDQRVHLSIYDSHIEIAVKDTSKGPVLKVPLDELGDIRIEEVLGMRALVIEDTGGVVVAAVRMEDPDAERAGRVLDRLQGRA